jgi:hypothetical protein
MPTMPLSDIRSRINSEYLDSNKVISGAEAKDLVKTVSGDALTRVGKSNLEKIRAEFKDSFSEAGLRAFDKALAKAAENLPTGATGGGNAVGLQAGRDLPASVQITLSQVSDNKVRDALSRLDFNTDGKVNDRDKDKMGFSDEQWRSFLFMAALMGQGINNDVDVPTDLSGKTVAFTAVPDKQKATEWAEAMGATVSNELNGDLDFLFVGAASTTGKDERAAALNALGLADIQLANYEAFSRKAAEAGVTGTVSDTLTATQLNKKIAEEVDAWYVEHINEHYDSELGDATTDAERAKVEEGRKNDLEYGAEHWSVPLDDASWYEHTDDGDFTDHLGRPINREDLIEVQVSFFPEYAGIGLGTYFLVDKRTGDFIDQGDIVD